METMNSLIWYVIKNSCVKMILSKAMSKNLKVPKLAISALLHEWYSLYNTTEGSNTTEVDMYLKQYETTGV